MQTKCAKCGYVRKEDDMAPEYECPNCGVIYSKVEETPEKDQKTKNCPFCGEKILAIAKKCKHCTSWLDEETSVDDPALQPAADYGFFLLVIPVISTLLIWFWISAMNLMQSPGDSLALIMLATIIGTALVASVEAGKAGMKADRENGSYSPVQWFFIITLLWIIGYPAYLFKRSRFGLSNRLAAGILVMFIFIGSWSMMNALIEDKKAEVRGNLKELQRQFDSLGR